MQMSTTQTTISKCWTNDKTELELPASDSGSCCYYLSIEWVYSLFELCGPYSQFSGDLSLLTVTLAANIRYNQDTGSYGNVAQRRRNRDAWNPGIDYPIRVQWQRWFFFCSKHFTNKATAIKDMVNQLISFNLEARNNNVLNMMMQKVIIRVPAAPENMQGFSFDKWQLMRK